MEEKSAIRTMSANKWEKWKERRAFDEKEIGKKERGFEENSLECFQVKWFRKNPFEDLGDSAVDLKKPEQRIILSLHFNHVSHGI